ncbi:hypothetical protein FPZ11_06185 [Humibacter ginsenosidimutans]|uniref:Uncharacterized protein n=1 Tax=Humibacter ginsenosidimutans TaxID=2599293 RepID=A0A5B8M2F2_9MICO|nr:hypothetical protein FPZ11_06185 [Humibacter ginsenosidimutans]
MRHPFDRIATIALLVLGLYDVIGAFSGTSSLVAQIDTMYRAFGIAGDYKATELTTTLGYVTAGVFVVLWVAAAALAAWSILRGRIAFWIPLAAGILAVFTSALMATILALHDPAFVSFYTQSGG